MKFKDLNGREKTTVLLGKILLEYKGTIITISHDRYFLDKVINKVIEIEGGKSNIYMGNYSSYVEEKEKYRKSVVDKSKEVEISMNATGFSKLNNLYKEKIELESQLDKFLEQWIMLNE